MRKLLVILLAALPLLGHADESQRAILLRAGATYSVVRGRVPDPAGQTIPMQCTLIVR